MSKWIFWMQRLTKAFGRQKVVLEDVTLAFLPGAKIGVLGMNGSGKSTLLRIMAGEDTEYEGEAEWAPDIRVGYLPQEPRLDAGKTVKENIEEGVAPMREALARFEEVSLLLGETEGEEFDRLMKEQDDLMTFIEAGGGWELDRTVEVAMDALRVPPGDADVTTLSGGERRRVALCRLLLSAPDLLLLDEPTNHLDAESVAWLEEHLARYEGTVVAVTHDRYFLDNVAGWILELDRGRALPFEGNYSAWLEQKAARLEQEKRESSARQRRIKNELEWVRLSPSARRTKNKARIRAYEDLVEKEREWTRHRDPGQIAIPASRRLGSQVLEFDGVTKAFGDRLLFENLSFSVPPGAIVGVIGPNGAGKTTLFRLIVGEESPDSGQVRVGDSVDLAYVDQSRDALSPDNQVWEEIAEGKDVLKIGGREVNPRAYCAAFNFRGSDQQRDVGTLSGGERNRVHMAKLLKRGGNFLLLDEPTNDLDVDTLANLERALNAFSGGAMIVSHDRWFLDRVATHILSFEGNSTVKWFEGTFDAYEEWKRKNLGAEALQPKRIKYRRLAH